MILRGLHLLYGFGMLSQYLLNHIYFAVDILGLSSILAKPGLFSICIEVGLERIVVEELGLLLLSQYLICF